MKPNRDVGVHLDQSDPQYRERIIRYINLKLAALGLPPYTKAGSEDLEIAHDLIEGFREKNNLLSEYLCPVDQRIQDFLNEYLDDAEEDTVPRLPSNTLVLDRYGLAREMSIPADGDEFITDIVHSYRIKQGVLHNPKNDRRTTKGSFHVCEGGLPVPFDKKSVPKTAFARILKAALKPTAELSLLPFSANQEEKAHTMVSLLLRPIVCPEVPTYTSEKSMEIRFFAPGNLVSNLDFVESIFGNAGDPNLPDNDAGLDPQHWTGHTGCVILAPHVSLLTKKELGLPQWDKATERQKKDGMAWKKEDELYNDGTPFKLTARNEEGVIVTIIADNYFGYSKKEVKTQIGYSANLSGLCEEEHAGGALTFPSYNLGVKFVPDSNLRSKGQTFDTIVKILGSTIDVKPEGYGVDTKYPNIIFLPENAVIDLESQQASWKEGSKTHSIRVLPENTYVHPTGYKIRMEKHPNSPNWRLVGTVAEGTLCHKPCTVSGGGKSEISKSLWDAIKFGPVYINDFEKDMDMAEAIINRDYHDRFKPEFHPGTKASRTILSERRSLGSVIKLLTPTEDCTDEFNDWLRSIPNHIKSLVFSIKRFYQPEWGDNWREHFSVDIINGVSGNQVKFKGLDLVGSYLRVGSRHDGSGWTYKLRQDFMPADKVQWEDDISASVIVPSKELEGLSESYKNRSVKITTNCESRFFQRPDDAVKKGYDKQAELDLSSQGNFISNFEPLKQEEAKELMQDTIDFYQYTDPMKDCIEEMATTDKDKYFIVSSHPRIVNGAPSKNVRYLQVRPDLLDDTDLYLAELGTRLYRQIPIDKPVYNPVNAVLPGRRNNPSDHEAGIRPLAVYNPIHYQELPEIFMDFTCSLTGKSPSTTGAGTEGALTKAPFNALVATTDLNNALLSFILGDYNGFTSAAGHIGPNYKVDHDVSLFIPEMWSRMSEAERDPKYLLDNGYLEKLEDFEYKGETIKASCLGYRITRKFTTNFLGRIFDNPETVFNDDMLKPELQNMDDFVDGIKNITETFAKVAKEYLADGSVEGFIPPLKAILHIMVDGTYEGKTIHDPEIRKLFTREYVINSDWYKERLKLQQSKKIDLYKKHIKNLTKFINDKKNSKTVERLDLKSRLALAENNLALCSEAGYLDKLEGTIGADPLYKI
ncbi:hypothetical protein [Spirochaeta cellobiosiphila]|uniref:hypothetical protein n=1 Tax=Spirochaeta cellobiosiphila TaxID=504483 RepID=UPI0003FFED96|nr:hypothetical protein [Spirochaeta cellobiosiphila]